MQRLHLSPPHIGAAEFEFVREAFETNWVAPVGPNIDAFEKEFAACVGAEHAVAVTSGTAALHLALRLAGVGPGDDVMVSTLTFCASVNPILYLGARPIFIDSEAGSWNLDPDLLEAELKRRAAAGRIPKALVLVHLYGQCADLDPIAALCNDYGIELIEDAAEALGALYWGGAGPGDALRSGLKTDYQGAAGDGWGGEIELPDGTDASGITSGDGAASADLLSIGARRGASHQPRNPGTFGRAGIFSFNGNKIITTSGGGMLVTDDEELARHARKLATQARDDAPHYQHSEIGYNYRMSNVVAGIGRGQLQVLAERVQARRTIFQWYREQMAELPGIAFMPEAAWGRSTRWLTCLTIDPRVFGADREAVRLALEAENIESRPVWKPMHRQPAYSEFAAVGGRVADGLFEAGLCLPSGSAMSEDDVRRVVETITRVHQKTNHARTWLGTSAVVSTLEGNSGDESKALVA